MKMRTTRKVLLWLGIGVMTVGLGASCGKKKDSGKGGKKGGAAASKCKEKNQLEVKANAKDVDLGGAFKFKKAIGFISGMRYNAKTTAKHAYIAMANYDVKLGPYTIDMPKEKGQVAVVLSFKTASKPVEFAKQKEFYSKLKVPTGDFPLGFMKAEQSVSVSVYVGGKRGGKVISGHSKIKGKGTLTHSSKDLVCGSLDLTTPNGTTMKGSFAVKVEKDLWNK